MNLLQLMMIVGLVIGGMGVALLGSIKVPLARRLAIDETKVGGLVSLFGFTLIPVIFSAGFLTDAIGPQAVLVGGSVLMMASLGLLAVARSYLAALAGVILLSSGWALMINVNNVLTPLAFVGSMTFATNLGNVFFGLGAFLTPLVVAALLRLTSFPQTLGLLAMFSLLPAILSAGIDFAAINPPAEIGAARPADFAVLLSDPMMWLLGLAVFFYGPLEASLGAWTTTYLGEQGCAELAAARLLSTFWLMFMASRLAAAFLLPVGAENEFLIAISLVCVGVLGGMVLARGRSSAAVTIVLAGTVVGPIFPTIMAMLLGHFSPELHGRAVGMLFAIGGIGWTLIPIAIGAVARRSGVRRAFSVAVAAGIGLVIIAILLARASQPAA